MDSDVVKEKYIDYIVIVIIFFIPIYELVSTADYCTCHTGVYLQLILFLPVSVGQN